MRISLVTVFVLVISWCASVVSTFAQEVKTNYTLEESIRIANTRATEVLKAENSVAISGAQILAAYGQFLPDFSVGGAYTYTGGTTLTSVTAPILVDSRRSNINYQVQTSLNLFNGYSDQATLKAARLSKDAAELTLERARQFIAFDVTQSYLQITLDRQIVEFATQNLTTSKQREEQLDELVKVGRRAQSDLYQQQSQTALDQQFLTNAENKLRNDKIFLARKLRIDPSLDYEFTDPVIDETSLPQGGNDERMLIAKALEQRVDLKSSRFSQDAANWYIKKYRGGYLPKVFVSGSAFGVGAHYNKLVVNNDQSTPTPNLPSWGSQLGNQILGVGALSINWTIFDRYYTKSNVVIARANAANALIDYENVNLQIVTETRQAYGNYMTALKQVETTEKGLTAAQRAFETVNGRYSVGAANFIELVITQNNLLLAKQNQAQVAINLFMQKKTLDYYLGN